MVSDALASDSPGVPIKTAESVPHLTCTESESRGVNSQAYTHSEDILHVILRPARYLNVSCGIL